MPQNVLSEPSKQHRNFLKKVKNKKDKKDIWEHLNNILLHFKRLFQCSFPLKKFSKIEISLQNVLVYLTLHILGKKKKGKKKAAASRVDIAYCSTQSKTILSPLG